MYKKASLRAAEIDADLMLKSTRVDGVYDKDPETNKDAVMYEHISYKEVVTNKLRVMDLTAISLAKESCIPIYITNIFEQDSLIRALKEEGNYSKIH